MIFLTHVKYLSCPKSITASWYDIFLSFGKATRHGSEKGGQGRVGQRPREWSRSTDADQSGLIVGQQYVRESGRPAVSWADANI